MYLFFWLHHTACGVLVPQPEMEPALRAVDVWSLKQCTTREVPRIKLLMTKEKVSTI